MRCIDMYRTIKQAMLAAGICLLVGSAQAAVIVSEVASWSSSNSAFMADWFELTNTGAATVPITGWRVDDGSPTFATALALNGITEILAGESVIFVESDSPATIVPAFKTAWFGASAPAGLRIGTYTGSGIGLSSNGDAVNIYNSAEVIQSAVTFGTADASSPFQTFDNSAGATGAISLLSQVGVNGAFSATAGGFTNVGSPGTITNVPEPTSAMLAVVALGGLITFVKRRSAR